MPISYACYTNDMSIIQDIIGFFENLTGNTDISGVIDAATTAKDDVVTTVTDATQGVVDSKDAIVDSIPKLK